MPIFDYIFRAGGDSRQTTEHVCPYVSFPDCIGVPIVIWHIILVMYKKPARSTSKFVRVFTL